MIHGILHSSFELRHSSFLLLVAGLFDRADFVAELGCLLVFLGRNCLLHLTAEANQLSLLFRAARAEFRHFADVTRLAMDVEQQRLELIGEADIVVRAAEAALLAKLEEGNAADRAGALVEASELLGGFTNGQGLCPQNRPTRAYIGNSIPPGGGESVCTHLA